ncbi:MAG: hypothetical protein JWN44_4712 [Myxococcales bacterium]|nr:hypothetical protein [Myxococcales bacterium]
MRKLPILIVLLTSSAAMADEPNPISSTVKGSYERVKKFIIGAADQMPAADYAYKPTPEVRSFGQLIGHLADANYMFCSAAKHEKLAPKNIEKTVTTRDALKKSLAEAFAYCDAVYAASTDATLKEAAELPFMKTSKFGALDINVAHDNEHYGNIVTYLRLKKIVPVSSQGRE